MSQFEWDKHNREHIARHDVTEQDCETAMLNPIATTPDPGHEEQRWETEGVVSSRRLIVIWTLRGELYRVVTAWWKGKRTRRS
jgi:uncharacterized DUF497 family protein